MRSSLITFVLLAISSVHAIPALIERQDGSSTDIDWAALSGAALDSAGPKPFPQPSVNSSFPYDFDSVVDDVVSDAAVQTTQVAGLPDSSDSDSGSSSLSKRATTGCVTENTNPASSLSNSLKLKTLSDFQNSKALTGSAQKSFNTDSITASGVKYKRAFSNKDAAYQGLTLLGSRSISQYNTAYCGQFCSFTSGCQGFNVFFERDPQYQLSDSCTTSDAIVTVRCNIWGEPLSEGGATYHGKSEQQFQSAVAGSSAWNMAARTPKSLDGYDMRTVNGNLDNRIATGDATLAPNWAGKIIILSASVITQPYDEALCKAVADNFDSAQSFSTYQLIADEVYMGQGCLVYSQQGFTDDQFNDPGQYREYSAAAKAYGKTGLAYWKYAPVVHYTKKLPKSSYTANFKTNPSGAEVATAVFGSGVTCSNPTIFSEDGSDASGHATTFSNGIAAGYRVESGVMFTTQNTASPVSNPSGGSVGLKCQLSQGASLVLGHCTCDGNGLNDSIKYHSPYFSADLFLNPVEYGVVSRKEFPYLPSTNGDDCTCRAVNYGFNVNSGEVALELSYSGSSGNSYLFYGSA